MQEGSRKAILVLSLTSSGFLLSIHLFSKTTDNESEKTTYSGRNHVAQDTRSTQPWHTVRLSTQQFMRAGDLSWDYSRLAPLAEVDACVATGNWSVWRKAAWVGPVRPELAT